MRILNVLRYRVTLALLWLVRLKYRLLGVKVGQGVFISWGAFIDVGYPNSITIGDGTFITRGAILVAHDHSVYRRVAFEVDNGRGYIHIGKNVFVGVGAIILRNVTIGDNAIIGAGSVVTKDVPANVIVAGNPAKIIQEFVPVSIPPINKS